MTCRVDAMGQGRHMPFLWPFSANSLKIGQGSKLELIYSTILYTIQYSTVDSLSYAPNQRICVHDRDIFGQTLADGITPRVEITDQHTEPKRGIWDSQIELCDVAEILKHRLALGL